MRYPDWLTLSRDGTRGGATDAPSGHYTPSPGGTLTVYDGPADLQDAGRSAPRDASGAPQGTPPPIVYLPEGRARTVLPLVQLGDLAVTRSAGVRRRATVEAIRTLDASLVLRWAL